MRDDIYDLAPDREVTADGRIKDDVRAAIMDGYRRGIYTGEQCFNFFDADKLWPPHRGEFWAIFYDGVRAARVAEEAIEDFPATCPPENYEPQLRHSLSRLERTPYRAGEL